MLYSKEFTFHHVGKLSIEQNLKLGIGIRFTLQRVMCKDGPGVGKQTLEDG